MTPYRKQKEELLHVSEKSALLPFLISQLKGQSRNAIKSYLSHRQIAINGRITTAFDAPLYAGDTVAIRSVGEIAPNPNHLISIVYEDNQILVADKKYGVKSLSTNNAKAGEQTAESIALEHILRHAKKDATIFAVTRLDRDVSGLLLFAKTAEAQQFLLEDAQRKRLTTTFVAVTERTPSDPEGILTNWLATDAKSGRTIRATTDGTGKKAITHYKVLKSNGRFAQVELRTETDCKHQIRAQLAFADCPIAGDKKYGAASNPLGRLCLHAQKLNFYHPQSGKAMTFDTGIPTYFR